MVSTPRPAGPSPKGRNGSGIYLLATESARSRITGEPHVTDRTITFEVTGLLVSGLYLPPSLSVEEVESTLHSLSRSEIILGDVNTRFPWLTSQSGKPGPPDRVVAFRSFSRTNAFRHLQPTTATDTINLKNARLDHELTVDHCFAKTVGTSTQLTLLNNASIDLRTDHKYTLHLRLDFGQGSDDLGGNPTLLRYRVGLLARQKVRKDVCSRFDTEVRRHPVLEIELELVLVLKLQLDVLIPTRYN